MPVCSYDAGKAVLSKSCILRLNGGKHSSLDTIAPECTLEIRPHLSFLDMAVRQVVIFYLFVYLFIDIFVSFCFQNLVFFKLMDVSFSSITLFFFIYHKIKSTTGYFFGSKIRRTN